MRHCMLLLITAFAAATFSIPATTVAQQPGSTGGTLGKTDKSATGGEEATPHSSNKTERHVHEPAVTGGRGVSKCGNLAGDWQYAHGPVARYTSGGAAIGLTDNSRGTWTCSGEEIIITWTSGVAAGHIHRMTLSADGQHFVGTGPLGFPLSAVRK
jgi:hypothetical protein